MTKKKNKQLGNYLSYTFIGLSSLCFTMGCDETDEFDLESIPGKKHEVVEQKELDAPLKEKKLNKMPYINIWKDLEGYTRVLENEYKSKLIQNKERSDLLLEYQKKVPVLSELIKYHKSSRGLTPDILINLGKEVNTVAQSESYLARYLTQSLYENIYNRFLNSRKIRSLTTKQADELFFLMNEKFKNNNLEFRFHGKDRVYDLVRKTSVNKDLSSIYRENKKRSSLGASRSIGEMVDTINNTLSSSSITPIEYFILGDLILHSSTNLFEVLMMRHMMKRSTQKYETEFKKYKIKSFPRDYTPSTIEIVEKIKKLNNITDDSVYKNLEELSKSKRMVLLRRTDTAENYKELYTALNKLEEKLSNEKSYDGQLISNIQYKVMGYAFFPPLLSDKKQRDYHADSLINIFPIQKRLKNHLIKDAYELIERASVSGSLIFDYLKLESLANLHLSSDKATQEKIQEKLLENIKKVLKTRVIDNRLQRLLMSISYNSNTNNPKLSKDISNLLTQNLELALKDYSNVVNMPILNNSFYKHTKDICKMSIRSFMLSYNLGNSKENGLDIITNSLNIYADSLSNAIAKSNGAGESIFLPTNEVLRDIKFMVNYTGDAKLDNELMKAFTKSKLFNDIPKLLLKESPKSLYQRQYHYDLACSIPKRIIGMLASSQLENKNEKIIEIYEDSFPLIMKTHHYDLPKNSEGFGDLFSSTYSHYVEALAQVGQHDKIVSSYHMCIVYCYDFVKEHNESFIDKTYEKDIETISKMLYQVYNAHQIMDKKELLSDVTSDIKKLVNSTLVKKYFSNGKVGSNYTYFKKIKELVE